MFRTIKTIFSIGDLRNKIFFTLAILFVFRIGAHIPAPGVNADVLDFEDLAAIGLLNAFGGGALENFSIFATGIMPYITASIIVQLLRMDVVPKFAEWSREGDQGRKKLAQVTRYGTVLIAFVQAIGMSFGFNNIMPGLVPDPSLLTYLMIALTLTAGTAFLLWLGETITAKGVGNGISLMIFAGIASAIPGGVAQIYTIYIQDAGEELFVNLVIVALIALAFLAITIGVIFVQQAIRKVPVQYAKRLGATGQSRGAQSSHLPLKVNSAGVIPVIFAMSLFIFPPTIANFTGAEGAFAQWVVQTFDYTNSIGMMVYALLIIGFTYFYTFVQMNPEQMAENLKKQNGFIPGIRPGKTTEAFITRTLYRLTFVGALFLATVSVLPVLFTRFAGLPQAIQIGGTGLLIVVGVALDTMKRIESQMIDRKYTGFMRR
ncbi:preprotein translocase subunit SecY [Salisediminibacterium halotolerans]|uniref:Protein translocase subunit SecY n=1 Tax=Salisediminibacterium halotolerans TaxID=517425 RepID=A0A1H9VNS8_9BACI|nr:preprotein translocase subunit SecY [Salisediminibacterium haloalkalitolerans]SES23194.1 preprotein translocase subunit SecY [Salisediminibacterium haloalkalitolerans]